MYRSKKRKPTASKHDLAHADSQSASTNITNVCNNRSIQSIESASATRVLFGIIGVSLLSIPVCYLLSYLKEVNNSFTLFLYSAVICVSVAPLTYFLLIKHLLHVRKETYFYVFTIFSFAAIADLLLALTVGGFSSVFDFYLEQGEVYLKTSHGLFICLWDGTVHYTLYLTMLYYMLKERTHTKFYRFLSLFWCGSISNSLIVLLCGAAVGQYGTEIKPSCLLNIPFVLCPIVFMIRQMSGRSSFVQQQVVKENSASIRTSFILRCLDVLFIVYMILAIILALFRALHALKTSMLVDSVYYQYEPYIVNESGFSLVQLLIYAFYFVPYYCSSIGALLFHHCQTLQFSWFPDWTMLHAGAAAQAQFSYLCSSLYNPVLVTDSSWFPIPSQYWLRTVTLNSILAIVPQLLAFRVCAGNRDRAFY